MALDGVTYSQLRKQTDSKCQRWHSGGTSGSEIGYSQAVARSQTGQRAIRDMVASRKSLVRERHVERCRWNSASGRVEGEGRGED